MAQALGVVHILISGEPSKHRLPQQSDQRMAAVLPGPRIGEHVPGHCAETEGVVEFAVGQQPSIGRDARPSELKLPATVETEPESLTEKELSDFRRL
jgi:hypothetical protein